jgi:hypothetical protein
MNIVGGLDARRCDRGAAVDHAAAVNWYQFSAGLLLGLGSGILITLLTIRRPNGARPALPPRLDDGSDDGDDDHGHYRQHFH